MDMDYKTIETLRRMHPAWRMLRSDYAPLIMSFLNRVFIVPNVRVMSQPDLAEALEDELYNLRQTMGQEAFPKTAIEYLNDWADNDKGWLRKFYPQGSDEPHFDLMPASETAIAWIGSLGERRFVGTESRLLTLFSLLKELSEGSETDPKARIAELQNRKKEIDAEIAAIRSGRISTLSETAIKDRFQQFMTSARELLSDFRQVEHNFRSLDRRVRERIALWEGSRGTLLQEIMGERDAIDESDQGRSFRAFWDFLMSTSRQEELTRLIDHALSLKPVAELQPDSRLRRIHYDWLEAGEHTQHTVAGLSQQLRRFLDDKAWLENRRIMEIIHAIEAKALAVREATPSGSFMALDENCADIDLPMERPLFIPSEKPLISDIIVEQGDEDIDAAALYSQVVIDRAALLRKIRNVLQSRSRITLRELIELEPLRHGLAELIAYLQLAGETFGAATDEDITETIAWKYTETDGEVGYRQARLPRIIFTRPA